MNTNKLYDWLKVIGQVILPSILTFLGVIGKELNWEYVETMMKIGTAFITMYNSIIIAWNKQYYKDLSIEVIDENKELG